MLHASRGALAATPTREALRARQAATLLREADDAIIGGDVVRARSSCVDALARAPRHIEIARRLVEIDARAGGRCEAALATLAETRLAPPGEACLGTMPGEMLLAVGDVVGAVASFVQAGEVESAPNLAARAFELGAGATRDGEEALGLLDRAIARSPCSISARWRRACLRLEHGRLVEALADVEHIDALARGGHLKAAIWLQAGRAWQKSGHAAQAGPLYERALRFAPDESRALLGLGTALLSAGHGARAVAVLSRALELADLSGAPTARIRLELARTLAEHLDDLPNAIAHAAVVEVDAPEAAEARGLEGRWRARLGDWPGAVLSFARLRELAATLGPSIDEGRAAMIAALLAEAADVERGGPTDVVSAKGHLMVALRLRPHDVELRRAYREIDGIVERSVAHERVGGRDEPIPRDPCPFVKRGLHTRVEDEARSAARVEELTRQLQMDPANEQVSQELASLLESLGRGHELVALLSARIEEAVPARRAEAIRLGREAIARMAAKADASGRSEDASFYRDAMGLLVE